MPLCRNMTVLILIKNDKTCAPLFFSLLLPTPSAELFHFGDSRTQPAKDLVPNVANWAGFYHPKLKAVWLSTGNVVNGMEEYQNMAFPCDDTKTPHRPGIYASTSLTMFLAGYPNQPLPLHKMTTYFERVNRIVMAAVGGAA